MAESESGRITCVGCGKTFRYKAELGGRKVKCKCDAVLELPPVTGPSSAEASDQYDLAQEPSPGICPSCRSRIEPGVVLCVSCGHNLAAGTRIQTEVSAADAAGEATPAAASGSIMASALKSRRMDRSALDEDSRREQLKTERYIPLGLIGTGIVLILINAFVLVPMTLAADEALAEETTAADAAAMSIFVLIVTAVQLAVQVPMLLVGILIVAKLFGPGYGTFFSALLKLFAAVVTGGVNACVSSGLEIITGGHGGIGWMVRTSIVFAVFLGLCHALFEMEFLEAFVLFLIMILLPAVAMIFLAEMLMGLV